MNPENRDPCWKGYDMLGMKTKGGKQVPNCVPVKKKGKKYSASPLSKSKAEAQLKALHIHTHK